MPAPRERIHDIALLAEHFAGIVAEQNGWKPRVFAPDALQELAAHGHRVAETARGLGLERSHLYKKWQQLGIDLKTERTQP